MKTIHLKGKLEDFDITTELSDNHNHDLSFNFEDPSTEEIKNAFIRAYLTNKECTLDEAVTGFTRSILGDLEVEGQEYGYSEYTIEGFSVLEAKIGGHDLNKIIKEWSKNYKYIHILIDQLETK